MSPRENFMNCYECGTAEGVQHWSLASSRMVVPLCQPCRKKLSYMFVSIEKAVFQSDEPKPKDWWLPILLVFMLVVGIVLVAYIVTGLLL